MRITLNESEQEALLQCSHEAARMYVLLLRPKMDIKTGIVGATYAISRGHLALDMAWKPPRGSHKPAYAPTIKQIRGLLDELCDNGLLKSYSKSAQSDNQLVFLLPFADRAEARLREEGPMKGRQEGPMKGRQEGRAQTQHTQGVAANEGPASFDDEGPMRGRQEGPISEYRSKNPLFIERAAVTGNSTGDQETEPCAPDRAVQVAKLLRAAGIDVTPTQLRVSTMADALMQSDADWQAAAEKAVRQKPGQRIGINYVLPIVTDFQRVPSGQPQRVVRGGTSRLDANRAAAEEAKKRLRAANGGVV